METPRPSRGRLIRRRIRQRRAAQLAVCITAVAVGVAALSVETPAEAQVSTPTRTGVTAAVSQAPSTTVPAAVTTSTVAASTVPTPAADVESTPATSVEAVAWHDVTTTVAVTAPPSTAPPTTAPPAMPPPTVARTNSETGIASYYDDPNGGCAHKTLPFGTVVYITASNGNTATCVVDDRGPFGAGRILDLDTEIFARLAPLSAGLVTVTATW